MSLLKKIFSVTNEYTLHHKYKIITLLGIKIKIKVKKLSKVHLELVNDPRFEIDTEFFCNSLAIYKISRYEITTIKLKDIKRYWKNKKILLKETHPYKYLQGQEKQYQDYCSENKKINQYAMSVERFEQLKNHINDDGFDNRFMPVIDEDNCILDGQHRCCILLEKFGEDHEIECIKIFR